jgi:hypothetical protein
MINSLENINDHLIESASYDYLEEGIFEDFMTKFGKGAAATKLKAVRKRPQMGAIMGAKDPAKISQRASNPIIGRGELDTGQHLNNILKVKRLGVANAAETRMKKIK